MNMFTSKKEFLYSIFISFLVLYSILTNTVYVITSIIFPILSILDSEKCHQSGPQISTDCQTNYEFTFLGKYVYRGSSSDNLAVTIKQASAAGPTINSRFDKESNSYPVYKIAILIIAFVGVPGALLILRSIINKADAIRLRSNIKIEVEISGGLRKEESEAGSREVPRSYTISKFDPKFKNALGNFFEEALKELEFIDLEQFQSVISWYLERTESSGEKRDHSFIPEK